MYLYDEIVIMDMCPTKRYNINSDDHERRGQKNLKHFDFCLDNFSMVFNISSTAYFFKWRNLLLKGQELLENVWHDIKSSSLKSKSLTPTIFSNWLIEDPLESKQQLGRKIFFERVFCIDVVRRWQSTTTTTTWWK